MVNHFKLTTVFGDLPLEVSPVAAVCEFLESLLLFLLRKILFFALSKSSRVGEGMIIGDFSRSYVIGATLDS